MPMKWITVRHEATGGETQIPEGALAGYRKRGWRLPAEIEAANEAAKQREQEPAHDSESSSPTTSLTEKIKEFL